MGAKTAIYSVIKPFDKSKCKTKITKRYRILLAKFDTVGYQFSPAEFIDKYKDSTLPSISKKSYRTAVQTALKIALSEGILKKDIGENKIPESFKELPSIVYWQGQLRTSKFKNLKKQAISTSRTYLHHLWPFNSWLQTQTFLIQKIIPLEDNIFKTRKEMTKFSDVEEVLRYLESPFARHSEIIKIIKKYLVDPKHEGKSPGAMSVTYSAIMSYFDKNEEPLKMKFDPSVKYDDNQEEQIDISLSLNELFDILTLGKPSITEKAVVLCKFHRGLDASTMADRFNFQALKQIQDYFKNENYKSWDLDMCPVPVNLVRIKNNYLHRGFLERDAIIAIQNYLEYVERKGIPLTDALFVNQSGRPISDNWITSHFFDLAVSSGVQKELPGHVSKKYTIGSHEVRDLLKSTLIDSGCKEYVADHVIGHMPKDTYEKQTKLYPETLRNEYAKASKRLNIFTKFTSIVNGTDDSDELKIQLKEKLSELDRIKERSLDDEARQYRSERAAIEQQRQMRILQDTVNELKKEMRGVRQTEKKPIEFCCISCSTVHSSQECPACGSKLKRIYEDDISK